MKYSVYLIVTKTKNKHISYVGYTNNLKKRVNLHNTGKGAKFTKGRRWKLIYSKDYLSKKKAMKEEYKLKKNHKLKNFIKKKYMLNDKI